MSDTVKELEPKEVWVHFDQLNGIPRPSKKEERVRAFMVEFGKGLGLETIEDKIGNIIIKKPATEGMENRQTVILQGHLDMVTQKNNDVDFNFDTDGIKTIVDGDWVRADGTTLGADNGIGVSAIMGILASNEISHPALEAFFTVDEETGMTGALKMDGSLFSGKILLNLDTEDEDEFSIGCAGGIDTDTHYEYEQVDSKTGITSYKIEVKGLMGGHSGMEINLGRGNANKLMARLLIQSETPVYLHEMQGGGLRNAIPRENVAIVSVDSEKATDFEKYIHQMNDTFRDEFDPVEKDLMVVLTKTETPEKMVAPYDTNAMLAALNAVHNGVYKMNLHLENFVETSSSLAQVSIKNGVFDTKSLQRSNRESMKYAIIRAIRSPFELLGADVKHDGDYPSWEPNYDSKLVAMMEEMFKERFGKLPNVMACHAGLECGIIAEHIPGLDMISFGPNILGAHSPDERVQISSVQKFWGFLLEVLKNIPEK